MIARMEEITIKKKEKCCKNWKWKENYIDKEQEQTKEEKPAPW